MIHNIKFKKVETYSLKEISELNKLMKKERTCILCQSEERNILFLPCAHLLVCQICSDCYNYCPITYCKQLIKEKKLIFR